MSTFTDNDSKTDTADSPLAPANQAPDPSRRRFSRSAIAGSAVLLSLGNRAAWGQEVGCMSVATLNSFNPSTGMFVSAPAGRPEHNEDLAAEIHRISSPPEFLDATDGTYSTCKDLDNVCLIQGDPSDCP